MDVTGHCLACLELRNVKLKSEAKIPFYPKRWNHTCTNPIQIDGKTLTVEEYTTCHDCKREIRGHAYQCWECEHYFDWYCLLYIAGHNLRTGSDFTIAEDAESAEYMEGRFLCTPCIVRAGFIGCEFVQGHYRYRLSNASRPEWYHSDIREEETCRIPSCSRSICYVSGTGGAADDLCTCPDCVNASGLCCFHQSLRYNCPQCGFGHVCRLHRLGCVTCDKMIGCAKCMPSHSDFALCAACKTMVDEALGELSIAKDLQIYLLSCLFTIDKKK